MVVGELSGNFEGCRIHHKADAFHPSQYIQFSVQDATALGEVLLVEIQPLKGAARFQVHTAHSGFTVLSGAFIEFSLIIEDRFSRYCIKILTN